MSCGMINWPAGLRTSRSKSRARLIPRNDTVATGFCSPDRNAQSCIGISLITADNQDATGQVGDQIRPRESAKNVSFDLDSYLGKKLIYRYHDANPLENPLYRRRNADKALWLSLTLVHPLVYVILPLNSSTIPSLRTLRASRTFNLYQSLIFPLISQTTRKLNSSSSHFGIFLFTNFPERSKSQQLSANASALRLSNTPAVSARSTLDPP